MCEIHVAIALLFSKLRSLTESGILWSRVWLHKARSQLRRLDGKNALFAEGRKRLGLLTSWITDGSSWGPA